ncbi:hypothetical protein GGF50DRAFT_37927, partial [Schizophyllum commune]
TRLINCFQEVRRIDAELILWRLSEAIEAHNAILACCHIQVIFPQLQGLNVIFNETRDLSAQGVQDLLTPLLSPGLTTIEVKSVCGDTIPMHNVFPMISSQVKGLQELSLPQLTGDGHSGTWLAGLRTLTLKEMHSAEDVFTVERMAGLQHLRISSQSRQLPNLALTAGAHKAGMRDGALPVLATIDLTAKRVEALGSLLLMLPPTLPLRSCKIFLRIADESWYEICAVLATAFDPTTFHHHRLGIGYESNDPEPLSDWRSAGLQRGQLDFLARYKNLQTLDFSADTVDGFWIHLDDNDIRNLAMSCPELCKLIIEASNEQTEANITLQSLMYL